ncbi:ABC transporter [Candidatus Falkowbacteria bacterium RIFOXYB2_FULL_34_18]|uniref:ABC transporter n=1 Tax=Candidatus Falkowbacteria bacterium RIFOXYD2_FULL_34_120 TaxID=1798007 RepID=A0A1F5TQZ4_9BACT|nr:MAG: ABC transporter [Candidatus Falkowbacteria bacterium RIFOXYB2_FULL_34_18]OGF29510.1 MAG: ABC transporter [Candidatus Falkowbacteria bacterium RIFOXYC12_FULL_34_55]OGF36880.1 MAG: ABC transporter [Candidatus Falkowbacteria bacterium RIFOXYC2_FULL_34_220]OGF39079.1 MAG: ABC transporter [Candidatus Falkowbacteria bacterium RIFOXYD12_FULL_34_57]OGF41268.1 MAG: ABC transporter [Candidatus Falkowbacteria bacterium RIFOXYD2_FULL_34_120]
MDKKYFKTIYVLFKKELMSYFNSPIAYIFIGVFLIVGNWLFFKNFYLIGQASMRAYFDLLPWIFLFMSPAISMRIWAEEKKSGTIEFLLTLPITDWQVVLAKFFSALAFLFVSLMLSITLPITVMYLGNMDIGPVIGGYIGALFLGGAYLALGVFISSLTKNQIIAFVLGLVACFVAFIIGADFVLLGAPQFLVPVMKFAGLGSHFYNIAKGVIDSKDVIYYCSFIFVFLWLNTRVIESRGWK